MGWSEGMSDADEVARERVAACDVRLDCVCEFACEKGRFAIITVFWYRGGLVAVCVYEMWKVAWVFAAVSETR